MLRAISFGVLRRAVPSTSAIMRSRKLWPGSWVMRTTMRSESTRVPPVTALRSPPDSRITGADSPGDRRLVHRGHALDHVAVARDQVAGLADHEVAGAQRRRRHALLGAAVASGAAPSSRCGSPAARWPGPCPVPRRRPRRSSRTPRSARARAATTPVNQRSSVRPRKRSARKIPVVMALPISTTNITGLRTCTRGSSLRREAQIAGTTMSLVKSLRRGAAFVVMGAGAGRPAGPGRG